MNTDPDTLERITQDAAALAARAFRVCEIGVVPLDRGEWHLLFGQQPLRDPYVSMVNDVLAAVRDANGVAFNVETDPKNRAWAALARLPLGTLLGSLRSQFYRLLSLRTGTPAGKIAVFAESAGDSAVLNARPELESVAGRVTALVLVLVWQGKDHPRQTEPVAVSRTPELGDDVFYRFRSNAMDATTERVVPAVVESVDDAGRVALRVFLEGENFRHDNASHSATEPFGWFWPTH